MDNEGHYPRMDWADACLVRMSELTPDCRIFTIDREDFSVTDAFVTSQSLPFFQTESVFVSF